jgi:hypothetical protein
MVETTLLLLRLPAPPTRMLLVAATAAPAVETVAIVRPIAAGLPMPSFCALDVD